MKSTIFSLIIAAGVALVSQGCQAQNHSTPATTEGSAPAGQTSTAPPAKAVVKNITGNDYLKMKAENPQIQLLDVRTPEEVAEGFIEGANKFNVHDAQFTEKVEKNLSKTAPVVVYCAVGGRSARAADILAQQGFTEVYNLTGGVTNWKAEGKPLVK